MPEDENNVSGKKHVNGTFVTLRKRLPTILILILSPFIVYYILPILQILCEKVRHFQPPPSSDIAMTCINVTNNQTIAVANYGIVALSSMFAIVVLITSFVGVVLTLILIGVGNFRQQFIDALINCKNKNIEMNKFMINKRGVWYYITGQDTESTLLAIATERSKIMYKNTKRFGKLISFVVFTSIFMILLIIGWMIFQAANVAELWTMIWWAMIIYTSILILLLLVTMWLIRGIVSYPDLAEFHKVLIDKIINKQKTPPENAEEKESGVTGEGAREGSNR